MKQIILILFLLSFSFATIITVDDDGPADYSIIQDAIDVSIDGDTVLVYRGFYQENLLINKSITLASYAIYDNLSNLESWTQYDVDGSLEWQVFNDNINETIIDGSAGTTVIINNQSIDVGSCILVYNENDCITPTIIGFTIKGGTGTQVVRNPGSENSAEQVLGGGILVGVANPLINYNKIIDNFSDTDCGDRGKCLYSGGGSYMSSYPEDFGFDNRLIDRTRCDIQEYNLANNFYNNNDAEYGNTFANRYFEETFNMSQSIFDVASCETEQVSSFWVYVEEESSTILQGSGSDLCAITAQDVYVDSSIPQECLDEGCGFENSPFKTITRALEMIMPSEDNLTTIHLASGIYSPDTGESFPINMISNVNIKGENEESTILDAMQTGRVISIENCYNNNISNLTITGGLIEYPYMGGGIFINSANPFINHVIVNNNEASGDNAVGGGIAIRNTYCPYSDYDCITNEQAHLVDLKIINNHSFDSGGLHIYASSPVLDSCYIANNESLDDGGGLGIFYLSFPMIYNTIIENNISPDKGGGIYTWAAMIRIYNSIIKDNNSNYGGGIFAADTDYKIVNSIIDNNDAIYGGGIFYGMSPEVVEAENYMFSIVNTVLINNNNYQFYCDDLFFPDGAKTLSIRYSNIFPSINNIFYSEETDNINLNNLVYGNPLFLNNENNDYTLLEGSPCIDAGTPDIDGDGVDDIIDYVGLAPDIGAFEFGMELSNDEENIPTTHTLKTPYPNPFNPVININFSVSNYDNVSISIYDIYGRLITTLVNSYFNPGHHSMSWNANSYASGVYIIKLIAGEFIDTQKIMLIK